MRRAAIVAFTLIALASCTLELQPPGITLSVEPAYARNNILVPYQVRGDGGYATASWELRRFESIAGDWVLRDSGQVTVLSETSGLLPFDLDEGWYQLTGRVLTKRGGVPASPPTLTRVDEFYVDVNPPWDSIELNDSQGGGPDPLGSYVPGVSLEVTPQYTGFVDATHDSPVRLHYRIDSTRRPTIDDPALEPGESIELWPGDANPYTRILSVMAIDDAGNEGAMRIEAYRAP